MTTRQGGGITRNTIKILLSQGGPWFNQPYLRLVEPR
jgi:hypothetical protein